MKFETQDLENKTIEELRVIAIGLHIAPSSSINTVPRNILISWIINEENKFYWSNRKKKIEHLEDKLSKANERIEQFEIEVEQQNENISKLEDEIDKAKQDAEELRFLRSQESAYSLRSFHGSGYKTWNWGTIFIFVFIVWTIFMFSRACGLDLTEPSSSSVDW